MKFRHFFQNLSPYIRLLRIEQWTKNTFIFFPLFFGQQLFSPKTIFFSIIGFFSFSFMASSIYCINDLFDVEADKKHPVKCHRPLASGQVKILDVKILIVGLCCLSLLINQLFQLNPLKILIVLLAYFILNLLYTVKLKQIAIVDVFIIAVGFILRLFVGSFSGDIELSRWIILMTFLLALFLAFAKRRDDVLIFQQSGVVTRKNILQYNIPFLNSILSLLSAVTIVAYIMYTVDDEVCRLLNNDYLYITSIFVIMGILRYLQQALVFSKSGSPTYILLKDRILQTIISCWIVSFLIILYL